MKKVNKKLKKKKGDIMGKRKLKIILSLIIVLVGILLVINLFNPTNDITVGAREEHRQAQAEASDGTPIPSIQIKTDKTLYEYVEGNEIRISPTVNTDWEELEYQWYKVGRMPGTASVINEMEGQNNKEFYIQSADVSLSRYYYFTVTPLKDGKPMTYSDGRKVEIYSYQINIKVHPKIEIELEGDTKEGAPELQKIENQDYNYELNLKHNATYNVTAKTFRRYSNRIENVGRDVTWSSSNNEAITVDASGYLNVIGTSDEPVIITATMKDIDNSERTAKIKVNITNIRVSEIELNPTELELEVGQTKQILATVKPEDANKPEVSWSVTQGAEYISVNENGEVTANALGENNQEVTAKVTATADEKTAEYTVKVVRTPVKEITIDVENHKEIDLVEKDSITIHANAHPTNATNKNLLWSVEPEGVVTISEGQDGNATITANEYNENLNTCKVTVSSESDPEVKEDFTIKVNKEVIKVKDIMLNSTKEELKVGGHFDFNVSVDPSNATYSDISWKVNDGYENIVSIDDSGLVVAKNIGTAYITVTVTCASPECPTHPATAEINVVPTPVESITLSEQNVTLRVGDTHNLTATITPEDATEKTIEWKSSNDDIATVENGTITAISKGEVDITANIDGKSAVCHVEVQNIPVEGIELNQDELKLKDNDEPYILIATVYPENAGNKELIWESSDTSVATVQNGIVTPVKEGNTIITVKSQENPEEIYEQCNVTVVPSKTDLTIYTVDQDTNFISGITLQLVKTEADGEKIIQEITSNGKYEFTGLTDGEYVIYALQFPTTDIYGNTIEFINKVEYYNFTVTDGKVIYSSQNENGEMIVQPTNSFVFVSTTDNSNSKIGIGTDFEGLEENYEKYLEEIKNLQQEEPKEPEQPEQTEQPELNEVPNQPETENEILKNNDNNSPKTSDIKIEIYIVAMIISFIGIIGLTIKKLKNR